MKCPHCNQEHPEGTRFCPFKGKEIYPLLRLSCPNPDCPNYGKKSLPANYRYCPLCNSELKTSHIECEINDKEGDCDINVLSFGPSRHKIAQTILSFVKPASSNKFTIEDAYNSTSFSQVDKKEAFEIKEQLERVGAKVEMKHFQYYVCDNCGATLRLEKTPKKCIKCKSSITTFKVINKANVTWCPICGSYKMNSNGEEYHCADCGCYSTIEEVCNFNNQ